jgi:hypothetical protein
MFSLLTFDCLVLRQVFSNISRLNEVRETSKARRRIVMKKLLAIALVLGFACVAANGALTFSSGGSDIDLVTPGSVLSGASISMAMNPAQTGYTIAIAATGGVSFDYSGISWTPMMFGNGLVAGTDTPTSARISGSNFMTPISGVMFSGLVVNGEGTVTITDFTTDTAGVALGSFDVVPEPITMSLLAIGGLGVLRRRRS